MVSSPLVKNKVPSRSMLVGWVLRITGSQTKSVEKREEPWTRGKLALPSTASRAVVGMPGRGTKIVDVGSRDAKDLVPDAFGVGKRAEDVFPLDRVRDGPVVGEQRGAQGLLRDRWWAWFRPRAPPRRPPSSRTQPHEAGGPGRESVWIGARR
jgi:hypothetical protein